MKVYGCPKQVAWDEPSFVGGLAFDRNAYFEAITAHKAKLKAWLKANGWSGNGTGGTLRFQVADGYAEYMLADGRRKACLIHLPYGDGYSYRDVSFLPKKEILKRIAAQEKFDAMFTKPRAS